MGYKMNGFSGFGNSPAKQYKQPVGPRADVKKPKGMTDKEDEIDAAKWQLEDKMKDEGVFSIGGQKNKSVKKYTSDDEEQAYENAQNDFDTDNPTKAQLAKALKEIKTDK